MRMLRPLALAVAFTVGAGLSMVGPDRAAVGTHSYTPSGGCAVAPPSGLNAGLVNMGFESDLTGWRLGTVVDEVAVTGADGFNAPFQGQKMVRLGKARADSRDLQPKGPNEICQDFVVDSPVESFAFRLFTWDTQRSDHFQFRVTVVNPATGQVVDRYNTTAWDIVEPIPTLRKTGWTIVSLDLAPHVGQALQLWFSAGGGGRSGEEFGFWAYVDQATKDLKSVSLVSKPKRPKAGKKAKLVTTVTPCLGHVGHPIELQVLKKKGWKTAGAKALDLLCQAVFKKRVKKPKKFRAFSPESGDHFEAYSKPRKVRPRK